MFQDLVDHRLLVIDETEKGFLINYIETIKRTESKLYITQTQKIDKIKENMKTSALPVMLLLWTILYYKKYFSQIEEEIDNINKNKYNEKQEEIDLKKQCLKKVIELELADLKVTKDTQEDIMHITKLNLLIDELPYYAADYNKLIEMCEELKVYIACLYNIQLDKLN